MRGGKNLTAESAASVRWAACRHKVLAGLARAGGAAGWGAVQPGRLFDDDLLASLVREGLVSAAGMPAGWVRLTPRGWNELGLPDPATVKGVRGGEDEGKGKAESETGGQENHGPGRRQGG